MKWYVLENELTINHTDGTKTVGQPGQVAYLDSTGCLAICEPSEVADIEVRVDAEILENIAKQEAEEATKAEALATE